MDQYEIGEPSAFKAIPLYNVKKNGIKVVLMHKISHMVCDDDSNSFNCYCVPIVTKNPGASHCKKEVAVSLKHHKMKDGNQNSTLSNAHIN